MLATLGQAWCEAAPVNFNRDVRPILSDRWFHCHGPDKHERKGKLRLDQVDGEHGAYRIRSGLHAIKPGDLKESELYSRMGCVGCHQHTHLTQAPKLEAVSEKYAATKGGLALIKTSLASGSLGN